MNTHLLAFHSLILAKIRPQSPYDVDAQVLNNIIVCGNIIMRYIFTRHAQICSCMHHRLCAFTIELTPFIFSF